MSYIIKEAKNYSTQARLDSEGHRLFKTLIEEIEKLYQKEIELSKIIGDHVDIGEGRIKQIKYLIRERDKLKNWGLRQEFDERGHTIQKLKAERDEHDGCIDQYKRENKLLSDRAEEYQVKFVNRQNEIKKLEAENAELNSGQLINQHRDSIYKLQTELAASEKAQLDAEEAFRKKKCGHIGT